MPASGDLPEIDEILRHITQVKNIWVPYRVYYMKNNYKRNHHYLPQFYLKYWANDKNKVWVYELHASNGSGRPNPSLLHIKKVCSEDYLYSIGNDTSIEEWADRNIENPCAPAFNKIIRREQIGNDDILYTKSFLALTMARHPLMKASSEIVFNSIPQDVEPLNPLAQTIRLRMKVNLIELNQLNLQILYIPNEIDAFFITSDVPFFIVAGLVKEKLGDREINRQTFDHVWFPISPKTLAFLSKVERSSVYEKITDTTRIKNINGELRSRAKDILIANKFDIF
jgi:hypothetical protein